MDSDDVHGDSWKSKLTFKEFDSRGYVSLESEWSHSCLRTDSIMEEICAGNNITVVRLYKEHVNAANILTHHAFVVFKTESRWKYSIERNRHGILLQRSKCMNDILHAASEGICDTKQQTGTGSIGKVVHFLWENNYLSQHYHPVRANCMQFALRIFNAFSFRNYVRDDSSDDDLDRFCIWYDLFYCKLYFRILWLNSVLRYTFFKNLRSQFLLRLYRIELQ